MDDVIDLTTETEPPPKRRRGRPPKSVQSATVTIEGESEDSTPVKRGRRSTKVTADQVTSMVTQGFALVAMLSKRPYWIVHPSEVTPWAKEATDLLNSIPSKYIKSFANASGYVVVGVGMYGIVAPRLAEDERQRKLIEIERKRKEESKAADVNGDSDEPSMLRLFPEDAVRN